MKIKSLYVNGNLNSDYSFDNLALDFSDIIQKSGNTYTLLRNIKIGEPINSNSGNLYEKMTYFVFEASDALDSDNNNTGEIIFDGNGFVMDVSERDSYGYSDGYEGMFNSPFAVGGANLTIKNLGIVGTTNVKSNNAYFMHSESSVSYNVTIDNCFVDGELNNIYTSGFSSTTVGINIYNSFSKCTLNARYCGGFIYDGDTSGSIVIKNSYFAGKMTEQEDSGLIHIRSLKNPITVEDCFSLCELTYQYQSSLVYVEYQYQQITIKNCYSDSLWNVNVHPNFSDIERLKSYNYFSSAILYVNEIHNNSTTTIENCYCLTQNDSINSSFGRCKLFNSRDSFHLVSISTNNYISHIEEDYTDVANVELLLDASSQTIIDTLLPNNSLIDASSSYLIDINTENTTITENSIPGFLRFFPVLRNFRITPSDANLSANWNWQPRFYQNMNSEPRQDIFLTSGTPYASYLDNSTFVDADFLNINKSIFPEVGNTSSLTLVQNLDSSIREIEPMNYRVDIRVVTELSGSQLYGYTYKFNTTDTVIVAIFSTITGTTVATTTSANVLNEYHLSYQLVGDDVNKGRYEIHIPGGYEIGLVHSTNDNGKDDDNFKYSGNSDGTTYTTRLNQTKTNGDPIDADIVFYSGIIYLDILGDFGSIDIFIRDNNNNAFHNSLSKFIYGDTKELLNNHIKNKIYTITYYGTEELIAYTDGSDLSKNRVSIGNQQIMLVLLNDFFTSIKKRGIDTYVKVIDVIHKTRTLVNTDLPNGVDYSILDILLNKFPQEFLVYKYTQNQIIQESFRDSDIGEREKYYLNDLLRIYNDYYRIGKYTDAIVYDTSIQNSLKTKLEETTMMNHPDFVGLENIYSNLSYNINNVDELVTFNEKIKVYESLKDEQLLKFLKRTNSNNIPNLLTFYPPKKDSELEVILDRTIAEVPPKTRYENYSANYVFVNDVSNILSEYNLRKSAVVFDIDDKNFSSVTDFVQDTVGTTIQTIFTNSTIKVQATSKNGQYYFAYIYNNINNGNSSFYLFQTYNDSANNEFKLIMPTGISYEIPFNDKNGDSITVPNMDDIKKVTVSDDGKTILLQTSTDIYISKFDTTDNPNTWVTCTSNDFHSTVTNNLATSFYNGLCHLKQDGSELYIVGIVNIKIFFIGSTIIPLLYPIFVSKFFRIKLNSIANIEGTPDLTLEFFSSKNNVYRYDEVENRILYLNSSNNNRINYYYVGSLTGKIELENSDFLGIYFITNNQLVYYRDYNNQSNIIQDIHIEDKYILGITESGNENRVFLFDLSGTNASDGSRKFYSNEVNELPINITGDNILTSYSLVSSSNNIDLVFDSNNNELYFTLGFSRYDTAQTLYGYQTVYKYNINSETFSINDTSGKSNENTILSIKGKAGELLGSRVQLGFDPTSKYTFIHTVNNITGNSTKENELIIYGDDITPESQSIIGKIKMTPST